MGTISGDTFRPLLTNLPALSILEWVGLSSAIFTLSWIVYLIIKNRSEIRKLQAIDEVKQTILLLLNERMEVSSSVIVKIAESVESLYNVKNLVSPSKIAMEIAHLYLKSNFLSEKSRTEYSLLFANIAGHIDKVKFLKSNLKKRVAFLLLYIVGIFMSIYSVFLLFDPNYSDEVKKAIILTGLGVALFFIVITAVTALQIIWSVFRYKKISNEQVRIPIKDVISEHR